MTLEQYKTLVTNYLAMDALGEYEQRMAAYYFSVGIPALICAKQIKRIRFPELRQSP